MNDDQRIFQEQMLQQWQQDIQSQSAKWPSQEERKRKKHKELIDHYSELVIKHQDCPHDPDDHTACARWVMERAEALIAAKERAMDKYDTAKSLE